MCFLLFLHNYLSNILSISEWKLLKVNPTPFFLQSRIIHWTFQFETVAMQFNKWWAAGPSLFDFDFHSNCVKNVFMDYLGIILICVMSTKLPRISLVKAELEHPT